LRADDELVLRHAHAREHVRRAPRLELHVAVSPDALVTYDRESPFVRRLIAAGAKPAA
jgi:hypothetical protein